MNGIIWFVITMVTITFILVVAVLFADFVNKKAAQSRKERELREAQSQHPERHLSDGAS